MNDGGQLRGDERPFDGQSDATGVVLHEERLRAGVERVEAGRVEVRKRIVTEEMTVTIPVRREVVDVVRVYDDGSEEALEVPASAWKPQVEFADAKTDARGAAGTLGADAKATDAADAKDSVFDVERAEQQARTSGADGQDIVLYEERPVVTTRLYAVERLRLDLTGETKVVPVTAEVAREVVEIDGVETHGLQDEGFRRDGDAPRV